MRHRYLLWFANEHLEFRVPEIKSILALLNIDMECLTEDTNSPFWVVNMNSDKDARQLASRSITLRHLLRLWGYGTSLPKLHESIQSYPKELIMFSLAEEKSFRVDVTTFNKTFPMSEKVKKIELFNYLPAKGPVSLKTPDTILHFIEYYGLDPNKLPDQPYHYYFGERICDGQREKIHKLSLKTRKFIGNTSMDAQLSLLMANMAKVKSGDIVLDPFVGTGSLLVAAASFGGLVLGTDIDFLMLHGRTRPTRKQAKKKPRDDESVLSNFKQYGLTSQYLDILVADSSLALWHPNLKFDSIITDPPYGIREATERIGSTKEYVISAQHVPTHIPSKIDYGLQNIFQDLLKFAAERLVLNGRLVSWVPIQVATYSEDRLPSHPALTLVANSEQPLTAATSRRLLTWQKTREIEEGDSIVPELFSGSFREHFYCGETRKERRERLATELKEKGLENLSRTRKTPEKI